MVEKQNAGGMDGLALKAEFAFFEKHLQTWLDQHPEKFVLIKGEEVAGFFDTFEAAYEAGVSRYGTVPFFIKQVLPEDPKASIPALAYGVIGAVPQHHRARR